MTVIEIKPHRWGWKACEAPGVERVFPKKDQAIDYAQNRACFRSGEVRISTRWETLSASYRSTMRIESCDAVIHVNDETGNVNQTHDHASDFREF